MQPSEASSARGLSAVLASLLLFAAVGQAGACSSSRKSKDDCDNTWGAGNDCPGGAAGAAGVAGTSGSAGVGGSAGGPVVDSGPSQCRGKATSPTAGKSCGCADDCDFGEVCASESEAGGPGGMCMHLCGIDGSCPAGMGCIELESGNPQTAACFPLCQAPRDCRPGYVCGPLTAGLFSILSDPPAGSFCVPYCQSDADCPHTGVCNRLTGVCNEPAASGGAVGDPCARVTQCAGIICHTGVPGGHCSTWCSVSKQGCPEGSACGQRVDGDWGFCLKTCNSVADCRAGYTCGLDLDANAELCLP